MNAIGTDDEVGTERELTRFGARRHLAGRGRAQHLSPEAPVDPGFGGDGIEQRALQRRQSFGMGVIAQEIGIDLSQLARGGSHGFLVL